MSNQSFHFLSHHPDNFLCRYMNNSLSSGSVKISTVCSCVSIYHIRIILFCTNIWKWWYLIVICFVLGDIFLVSATAIKPWLPSNTLQDTSVFLRCIMKIKETSLTNSIEGITSRIAWLNKIYSASMVLKAIYICNLLQNNAGHPTYIITYPVHDMKFSALSESAWSHPPEN